MSLHFTVEDHVDETTSDAIVGGLSAHGNAVQPGGRWKPIWIVARDGAGDLKAGLRGVLVYNYLFVEWLWVDEAYRKQGVGSRLLGEAEVTARSRGCDHVYLDTFTFQAPDFYRRLGYREFGRLDDFPPGHSRIWFVKGL